MILAPGARLGPYEIVEPIGKGGMGEVYRARDEPLDRSVAIKIVAGDRGKRIRADRPQRLAAIERGREREQARLRAKG
jgi:serine/threonine protein kinase